MMLEEMLKDEREAGRDEGLKIGRLEGEKRGEEQSLALVNALMSQGRYEDLKRCLEDEVFRKELMKEFGLKSKE
ncbi:MarR-like DNA-binding transcriptional regulator SgrR of sgrS sRNA [Catenibacillus scindens]|uniref:MarR-like DNA-binding transcriptional regulator SgrR of sgrS sRNA n=1 Tax=Catenibacillus scindens TaxID=673271 RepID=A0A7W8M4C3_9FIRM|nr:hypothetical protein [Catenibacillus scindens]MBB5263156.1 MarR-like DNA-binding transcriptional regulator SgrR of sgrS sRNA [Catenibacillus scindens]